MVTAPFAFGNDPSKIDRYQAFWTRADVRRPLVGFSLVGWFPLEEFSACKAWGSADYLTPDMIRPDAFLDDHLRILREGEIMDDDLIRGACPAQVAIPWLPGMVGAQVRILPHNCMGEERHAGWDELDELRLDCTNPWYRKYLEFATELAQVAAGRFPVSHAPEIGPTDLHAVLRGHTASLLDLCDEPDRSAALLQRLGDIFIEATASLWQHLPLFHGGWFDAQYSLWSPAPIVRMQEDATAVYSPRLYRDFVQPVDRRIAAHFAGSFMHLHSTSMFLLDDILAIEEIRCLEINQDALGPPVAQMIPHFQKVQEAGKPLLVRGSFTPEEFRMLAGALNPRGLFLNVMVETMAEVEPLRKIIGL